MVEWIDLDIVLNRHRDFTGSLVKISMISSCGRLSKLFLLLLAIRFLISSDESSFGRSWGNVIGCGGSTSLGDRMGTWQRANLYVVESGHV